MWKLFDRNSYQRNMFVLVRVLCCERVYVFLEDVFWKHINRWIVRFIAWIKQYNFACRDKWSKSWASFSTFISNEQQICITSCITTTYNLLSRKCQMFHQFCALPRSIQEEYPFQPSKNFTVFLAKQKAYAVFRESFGEADVATPWLNGSLISRVWV